MPASGVCFAPLGWLRGDFPGKVLAHAMMSLRSPFGATAAAALVCLVCLRSAFAAAPPGNDRFEGRFFRGAGDVEYLRLLDISRRMYAEDPEFQSMPMLYRSSWNGLVEGPTWDAWWVQNSYGTTYCALPFYEEPFVTFLQNAQDLWFDKMGDGKTSYVWNGKDSWVPPDGCLMDCANQTWAMHRQGDGRVAIHDWGMEFTAGGALLQSELLLISRDKAAIARYLPKLERCAAFIETRRDPRNDLFLAGAAGNLLAPSYAGSKLPDGTYGKGYLTGLSVTYIAFLDRLIELQKLAGHADRADFHAANRAAARRGLDRMATEEGYFIKYMDPDGTRHGVYGAPKHGYFEASPNHDAICFRVVDDAQSGRIYRKLASIPGLRPYDLVVANSPSLDDMYEAPEGLWGFGTWVNGGHWTTCEARMIMAYYRVGQYEDARRAMKQMLSFARKFRMDNPLVKFGSEVYQPREPINITYDAYGAPAAMIRGLFEYVYGAAGLTIRPQIPPGIARLEQVFPIRFGTKQVYLAVTGQGRITQVRVNGHKWKVPKDDSVFLPYGETPDRAAVLIVRGDAAPFKWQPPRTDLATPLIPPSTGFRELKEPGVIVSNELPLRIGGDSDGGSRFIGEIARACIFSRALRPEEVQALTMTNEARSVLADPALLANWSFQSDAQGVFNDQAGLKLGGATAHGKVETVRSPFGPALRLTGEGYLEIPSTPALDLRKGGTLHVLVKPGVTNGRLLDKCRVGESSGFTFDTYPGNALRVITDAGTVSAAGPVAAGEWVHLTATVDDKANITLYVGGRKVASAAGGGASSRPDLAGLLGRADRIRRFHQAMVRTGLGNGYEAAHAALAVRCLDAAHRRVEMLRTGALPELPERSETAAEKLYLETVVRLCEGLEKRLNGYEKDSQAAHGRVYKLWKETLP